MACRFRIATPEARRGLPEVTLGLVPGAGGTVLLPRLVPAETALEMLATGRALDAVAARECGLVDRLAEDLDVAAEALAREVAQGTGRAAVFERPVNAVADHAAFEAQAGRIAKRARGQVAPAEALRLLRGALATPAEEALAEERRTFLRLRESEQARALRHVFLAERATIRMERLEGVEARPLAVIGVVGGGTMGTGIAAACLLADLRVEMIERDAGVAIAGRGRVAEILQGARTRGRITEERQAALLAGFRDGTDDSALAGADLVIEAVFEEMEAKRAVFARLDAFTRPQAVLATNTSYLDVGEIARGVALARRLRKVPVLAGVCDGFIANRIMSAYRRECEFTLEDGAL